MTLSDRAAVEAARRTSSRSDWREDYAVPSSRITEPNRKLKTALTTGPSRNRQRAFHSAKDYETSASALGEIEPTPASAKDKARVVAAEQLLRREPDATAEDLTELLNMLGIHPDQPDWDDGPNTAPRSRPKGM